MPPHLKTARQRARLVLPSMATLASSLTPAQVERTNASWRALHSSASREWTPSRWDSFECHEIEGDCFLLIGLVLHIHVFTSHMRIRQENQQGNLTMWLLYGH